MQHEAAITHGKIQYWTHHDEQPDTIVMIHGFTGSHKGFNQLTPLLKDYRLIIPDLPGFGISDLPAEEYWSIHCLSKVLNDFTRSLNLEKPPVIFGHSMGGLVVSAMVDHDPTLFDDVILMSPVPTAVRRRDSRSPGAVLGALQYRIGAATGRAGDRLVRSKQIARFTTKLMARSRDPEMTQFIIDNHLENLDYISSLHFYKNLYRDINRHGAIDYADILQTKSVALIVGDKDNVTPLKEEEKLRRAINPEAYAVIPNVGHLIHYEKAAEAAEIIRAFLSRRR